MKNLYFIAILSIVISLEVNAQDLGAIKDQKPVEFSGNVNLSLNTYTSNRESPSRDGFLWTLSGSPTLSFYGITMPFSFVISKKNESFRQPFNEYGASPYYKWVKLHLGYRSMSFSDYSLNGHQFLGAGVELTPKNWRFGAMYGRLLKPIDPDPLAIYPVQPTYLRKGYSVKVGYGTSSNYLDLILFKGWDDPNSIDRPLDSAVVNPQQNLVLGIKTQQRLFKKLTFSMDVGLSGWTSNLFAQGLPDETIPLEGLITSLLDVNYSTQFLKAGKASLSYRIGGVSLRAQYERVEPEYQTMGAYYFNTDQENITLSPSFSLLKRKMRVNASVGWMKNNLFDNKINQTTRRINSLQVSYAPIEKFNVSVAYNNFQFRQQQIDRIQRDVIDSLQLEQFSNSVSINANYSFGSKEQRYSLSGGFSNQSTDQEQMNETLGNNETRSITPTVSFRYNDTESKWGYSASFNYNDFENININSQRWGVNLSANKNISDDKLSLNGSFGYNQTKLDGVSGGSTINVGLRGNFKPAEKHSIGLMTNLVKRNSTNARIENFSEFIGSINYSYSF